VTSFSVPNRIITDNGSQFTSNLFRTYCANLGTQICYALMAHPRSKGQAERANAEVLGGLKTRSFKKKLEAYGRGWLGELQFVLWSVRPTATKPTGETPFFLVYGAEAVLLHEVKHRSSRVLAFDEACQDASRGTNLVPGEEARHQASLRTTRYQQALRRYHCRSIRSRTLEVGDLILRRVLSGEGLQRLLPRGRTRSRLLASPGPAPHARRRRTGSPSEMLGRSSASASSTRDTLTL
jgi:transposase InsO family protein